MDQPQFLPPNRLVQWGFTLVEVLVVIVIMGILAGIAVPSLMQMVAGQKVRSAASDMYSALLLARSEAMKRNTTVNVNATNAADWSRGWTVGISGTTFLTQDAYNGGVAIATTVGGTARSTVAYQWTGRPDSASTNTSITVSSTDYSLPARCITLNLSGMPQIKSC